MSSLKRILDANLSETDLRKKRLNYLTASETVLKYHFMIGDDAAQKLIDCVIKKSETNPDLKEYANQFKVLSDQHRVEAKKAYVEFFFKGLTNVDCAKHVASFVTV